MREYRSGRGIGREDSPRAKSMAGDSVRIADLHHIPERYLRSVHLERDFNDSTLLRQYVVTPPIVQAMVRILEGLRPGATRRAWRITGDYGVGKSSFALLLSHLLRDPSVPALTSLKQALGLRVQGLRLQRLAPILLTGARESFGSSIASGLARAFASQRTPPRHVRALQQLQRQAARVNRERGGGGLVELLERANEHSRALGFAGLLLVVDELGKLLEHAALHPDREDVYSIQQLAEAAARSGSEPLVIVGILHQGFHAYAERLPATVRHEWDKVAERFDEIVFDQPLAHTAALVSAALNVDVARVPVTIRNFARMVNEETFATKWYDGAATQPIMVDPVGLYPLHPTVLPVLTRFFARFGQHERSLFSLLLSGEPFGLQAFALRQATGREWYRIADFFDYVRAVFGHRLAGASYRSHWARIVGIVDSIRDVTPMELRVVKTVAVLNVLDAEHLLATDVVLAATVDAQNGSEDASSAVRALKQRGILFDRGAAGGYCLWPSTSANLDAAFQAASQALGQPGNVAQHIGPYLDPSSLVARRHYIETGTLRHFEVRYVAGSSLVQGVAEETSADGLIVVVLCDDSIDRQAAIANAAELGRGRPDVLIAIPQPLLGLAGDLHDARCWEWVQRNTPEVGGDQFASAEVARQVTNARQALQRRLAEFIGFRGGASSSTVSWWRDGNPLQMPVERGVLGVLSRICDELYAEAPRIRNELLNRRILSSPAFAARMRLIEHMFSHTSQPVLGIDPAKAPPEKSMYLSVLAAGSIHRLIGAEYGIDLPLTTHDPLHLRPSLERILELLANEGGRPVAIPRIIDALSARPFGVRAGVAFLLVAVVAVARAHDLAVYERGTFQPRFGPDAFLRLIKNPTAFELQLCRVTGVRAEVFARLAEVFVNRPSHDRALELLDVVQPLCTFAAQLPEYSRRAEDMSPVATAVRDALLAAREPATLLFQSLPIACGTSPFVADGPADRRHIDQFVATLRVALDELRIAYSQLLDRITDRVARAFGETRISFDRSKLADRGSRVAIEAREPRLRAFALRLADSALGTDAWSESIGSLVMAKPPTRWSSRDEAKARDEIEVLAATFQRVEAIAFDRTRHDNVEHGLRLGITRADGREVARVVHLDSHDASVMSDLVREIESMLPPHDTLRIAAIAELLWRHMSRGDALPPLDECDSPSWRPM
jgi:hypothetical protein